MAVTGDIFRSLTFDGEPSRDYGVYITGQAVYNAPERDVEMVTIPGRNGAFALDKGRFENIEVTYPAGVFANTDTEFAKAISDFRNMLCSRQGYCRLTDEYNPDEYRLAVYKSGLEVDPVQLKAGQFDITFECKPQRYLTSGEEKKVLGTWGDTETKTGEIVELENDGTLAVKSAEVALEPQQDLHGYDKPWSGGNGKNKLEPLDVASGSGVTFTRDADGVITVNGTATANTFPNIGQFVGDGNTYKLSGVTNGSSTTYRINLYAGSTVMAQSVSGDSSAFTATNGQEYTARLYINSGTVLNNVKIYPMLRLSTESADYEPYSNICPITGASDVEIYADGKYGGEIEWNQYCKGEAKTATSNGITFTETADGVWNINGTATATANVVLINGMQMYAGHKYIVSGGVSNSVYIVASNSSIWTGNKRFDYTNGTIFPCQTNGSASLLLEVANGTVCNNIKTTPQFTDLTQLFGSTKADEIYAMEQQTAGSGVAYFKSLFYKDYYAYDAGTTTCVSAVNGNPYEHTNTSLGTTVYGGSVDVVAGTGTSRYKKITITSTSQLGTGHTSANGYYVGIVGSNDAKYINNEPTVISSMLKGVSENELETTENKALFRVYVANNNYVVIKTASTSTISSNSDLLSVINGVEICYELATPTTLTLTPTTVNLIDGTNYVFSPQGEITLEYGTNPNYVVNPTLFGCGPLIEAKGYGDIQFNGYTIKLANGVIGTVNLWQQTSGGTFNGSITKTFVTGQFEPTDTFSFTVTHMFTLSEVNPSITNTNANATNSRDIGVGWEITYRIDLPCTFTVGTTGQITNTSTYDFGSGKKVISDMDVSYDSTTGTVVYTVATTTQGQPSFEGTKHGFSISECNAVSTLNRLGNPTYIDCDLGEAYKINGGDVVSLNSFVDLGSNLPELAPGANLFSVDNTFTEVAVVPRWWTV